MGWRPVPNGSIRVELSEPISHFELFNRMDTAAKNAGFLSQRSQPALKADYVRADPVPIPPEFKPHLFTWHPTEESTNTDSDYHILVSWEEVDETTDWFLFIFNQGGADPFEAQEWLLFYRWMEVLIPAAFPDRDLSMTVTRHPVVYTECDNMDNVSKQTGIPIPDMVDWCDE
ncbi:MAG: hypothetical protein ACR2QS_12685 [Woeseiaceae bacterium]